MDDELRASISISVIDKYLEASTFTEDRDSVGNTAVPHTSGVVRSRYDGNFKNAIGSSFTTAIGEYQLAPQGISNGVMPYFEVDTLGVSIGTSGNEFLMLYVKHTGRLFSSTTELGDTSTRRIKVRKQLTSGGSPTFVDVCVLSAGQFMFIPTTGDLDPGCNWNLMLDAGPAVTVAAQYAILGENL